MHFCGEDAVLLLETLSEIARARKTDAIGGFLDTGFGVAAEHSERC